MDVLNPKASKTSNWARKFFLGMGIIISSFLSVGTAPPGVALRGIASCL
ncbi:MULTISPECIES: hypothetical protein [Candidatus Rhabdochlamydia]|nr:MULTISPECIES: hypothetical protein [Rhabdochlamydia]